MKLDLPTAGMAAALFPAKVDSASELPDGEEARFDFAAILGEASTAVSTEPSGGKAAMASGRIVPVLPDNEIMESEPEIAISEESGAAPVETIGEAAPVPEIAEFTKAIELVLSPIAVSVAIADVEGGIAPPVPSQPEPVIPNGRPVPTIPNYNPPAVKPAVLQNTISVSREPAKTPENPSVARAAPRLIDPEVQDAELPAARPGQLAPRAEPTALREISTQRALTPFIRTMLHEQFIAQTASASTVALSAQPAILAEASAPALQSVTLPSLSAFQHTQPSIEQPRDFSALIDRLVQAREAAGPGSAATLRMTLPHSEFGGVTMRVDQSGGNLAVAVASTDPAFAPAARAALVDTTAQEQQHRGGAGSDRQADQHNTRASTNDGGQGRDGRDPPRFNPNQTGDDAVLIRREPAAVPHKYTDRGLYI